MKKAKIISLLLASLLALSSLTGCSGAGENAESDTSADGAVKDTVISDELVEEDKEISRENMPDTLPENLDFDGLTVNIMCRGSIDEIEVHVDELTGEPVSDFIFNRNNDVAERLNINFTYSPIGTSSAQGFPGEVSNSVKANVDDYQIFAWAQYSVLPLCLQGMIMDIKDNQYIDLSMPWWNNDYMNTLQIGNDKRFFLMGDICLTSLKMMSACFFNQSMYNDLYGDYNNLYNSVLEGEWDIDMLYELAEGAYVDANGNGKYDNNDIYGCLTTTVANTDHFAFDMGMKVIGRDNDGLPTLIMQDERNYTLADKMNNFYWNNKGVITTYGDGDVWLGNVAANIFSQDKVLFLPLWLQTCESLRDMESGYGIIPYPKLDETQPEYFTLCHDTTSIYCLPVTCLHPDEVGAVIEAMCAQNYRTVVPAYYDIALKNKYSRDEISGQMIDILHDTADTDFGYAYNYSLGEPGTIMRGVVQNNSSLSSTLAKKIKPINKSLEKLIKAYTEE